MGTWNYHGGPGPLREGLRAGVRFIDTAESYETEAVVGEAVHGVRDGVLIATKVSSRNFRAADLRRSVDASLLKLGTDWIDLLQLHEPNPAVPLEETMGALADVVDEGKVRFVGVSNFSISQLKQAQEALGRYPVVSNQVRYNLIDRTIESGLLQYCQSNRICVIAYSPLGRELQRVFDCDPTGVLDELSRSTGRSVANILLGWCLAKDGVVVIPKGNSAEHILDNCGAAGWRLDPGQISMLDSRIRHRQRGRLDALLRRHLPGPLRTVALRASKMLPRTLRRRVS